LLSAAGLGERAAQRERLNQFHPDRDWFVTV
jgi:hypothetical protein